MNGVCAILPALNEEEALPVALADRPGGVDVIVVDNGSNDDTAAVARALGARVVVEPRRGYGAACWAGVQAAPAGTVLAFMDADGSLTWPDLQRVAAPVLDGRAGLCVGWRRPDVRERGAMPRHVAAANAGLGRLCGRIAGTTLHDIGPLRAIGREALLGLGMRDRTYGWPLEMVLRAARSGLPILEVPISYRRRTGTSKVTGRPWPTVKTAARMSAVLLRHAREAR